MYTLRFRGTNLKVKTLSSIMAPSQDLQVVLEYEANPRLQGRVVYVDTHKPVEEFRARMIRHQAIRSVPYTPPAHRVNSGSLGVRS